jgi:hypothetical protein
MMDKNGGDDAFAERIAKPLRAREGADETFEARAMSAVHAVARAEAEAQTTRSWWLRPRAIHLTPLATMALAAGFAALVWIGARASNATQTEATAAAAADTVHVVRFVLVDSSAQRVSIVGAFNQWQKNATVMAAASSPGVWVVEVPLRRGRHEYAFVVVDERGERWVADPFSQTLHDDFGTETSVIKVGASATS